MSIFKGPLVAVAIMGAAFALAGCGPQLHAGAHASISSGGGIQTGAGIGVTVGARPAHGPRPPGFCTFRDRRTGQLYYAPCR